jgi:hypothetical protein
VRAVEGEGEERAVGDSATPGQVEVPQMRAQLRSAREALVRYLLEAWRQTPNKVREGAVMECIDNWRETRRRRSGRNGSVFSSFL